MFARKTKIRRRLVSRLLISLGESEGQQLLARDVPGVLGREGGELAVLWNA